MSSATFFVRRQFPKKRLRAIGGDRVASALNGNSIHLAINISEFQLPQGDGIE